MAAISDYILVHCIDMNCDSIMVWSSSFDQHACRGPAKHALLSHVNRITHNNRLLPCPLPVSKQRAWMQIHIAVCCSHPVLLLTLSLCSFDVWRLFIFIKRIHDIYINHNNQWKIWLIISVSFQLAFYFSCLWCVQKIIYIYYEKAYHSFPVTF